MLSSRQIRLTVTCFLLLTVIFLLLLLLLEKNYLKASSVFQPQQQNEYDVHVYVKSIATPLLALFIFMVFLHALATTILFAPMRTTPARPLVLFVSREPPSCNNNAQKMPSLW
ncbi:hypothetical protein PIB30_031027 [Stylosanthes scabra]|uniref:Transmembrane protein n=1 Tax=Stylosanthes scabra TaxID=79078 RepID=A0ABU6Z8K8_9FABA|nr:hypothetical protein [Stylosanthes scabra]